MHRRSSSQDNESPMDRLYEYYTQVSYLTVMDKLILVSFLLLFAVACECLLVYVLSSSDHRCVVARMDQG